MSVIQSTEFKATFKMEPGDNRLRTVAVKWVRVSWNSSLALLILTVALQQARGFQMNTAAEKEDCNTYKRENLQLVKGPSGWQVMDGIVRLLAVKTEAEGREALAVAMRNTAQCFIGRGNRRTDRRNYIVLYWKGTAMPLASLEGGDCVKYNPAKLRVIKDQTQWALRDEQRLVATLDSEADALKALVLAKRHTQRCFIGRRDRSVIQLDFSVVEYWR